MWNSIEIFFESYKFKQDYLRRKMYSSSSKSAYKKLKIKSKI